MVSSFGKDPFGKMKVKKEILKAENVSYGDIESES